MCHYKEGFVVNMSLGMYRRKNVVSVGSCVIGDGK